MPRIEHKLVGAFHVFTSPDVLGLHVADRNEQVAFERVQPTIEALQRMRERKERERSYLHAAAE